MFLCSMKTVGEVFGQFKEHLKGLYEANELQAVSLFALNELTGKSKAQLKAFPETALTATQSEELTQVLLKLATGLPVQYAIGRTEFYGLPFNVTPDVLIPRPETEELVEWILQEAADRQWYAPQIIDIGTGSGCIAIALQKNLPRSAVSAIDISEAALQVAKANASLNEVPVNFIQANILDKRYSPFEKSNIIVSNPPYVTQQDRQLMHNRVTDFEPHMALFVPRENPLLFYKAIADFALQHLAKDGLLFFEINESLGSETVDMLENKGFNHVNLRKDMPGKDRMIKASR
jgi:release factor glutamine methyltransferase